MSSLNRQQITTLTNAIKRRSTRVLLSPTWRHIHDTFNIGVIDGRHLKMSRDDYVILRAALESELGSDPIALALDGDRTSVAGQTRNEKLALKRPTGGRVLITSQTGKLQIGSYAALIPPSTALWVDYHDISLPTGAPLIIVENLDAINNWSLFNLPEELCDVVAVYRGNDINTRAVIDWIEEEAHRSIIAFADFDLAGLHIALSLNATDILVPVDPDSIIKQKRDKPAAFNEQVAKFQVPPKNLPGAWNDVWSWVMRRHTTITQEAMASSSVALQRLTREKAL